MTSLRAVLLASIFGAALIVAGVAVLAGLGWSLIAGGAGVLVGVGVLLRDDGKASP